MAAENNKEYNLAVTQRVYSGSGQYCILNGYTDHVTAENKSEYSIALTYKVFSCSLTETWECQ